MGEKESDLIFGGDPDFCGFYIVHDLCHCLLCYVITCMMVTCYWLFFLNLRTYRLCLNYCLH